VRLSEKVGLQLQLEEQDLKAIQYVRRDAGKPSLQFFESCNITREGLAAGKQASGVSQSGGGRSLERSSRDALMLACRPADVPVSLPKISSGSRSAL